MKVLQPPCAYPRRDEKDASAAENSFPPAPAVALPHQTACVRGTGLAQKSAILGTPDVKELFRVHDLGGTRSWGAFGKGWELPEHPLPH